MIIKTTNFKDVCSKILGAIDSSEISTLSETLELKTEGKTLFLNVTNKEYFASIKFDLEHEEVFHATVNATLFLKLIAQITAENIEMTVHDTYLGIKANGNYKIPLIFDGEALLVLPKITITNVTTSMNIPGAVLESITTHNSKQLLRGTVKQPVQKMYYLDQEGCITFVSGACVNTFTLEKPISLLLNSRLVRLFKLFKNDMVEFKLGYDPLSDQIIQTKVSFETAAITLTAILSSDDTLLNSFPAKVIRNRALYAYPHEVVVNKEALVGAINRLLLFSAGYGDKQNLKPYGKFTFEKEKVVIDEAKGDNTETLNYQNTSNITTPYDLTVDLEDFKLVLDGTTDEYINIRFGDTDLKGKGLVVVKNNIINVIPQVVSRTVGD